MARAGNCWVSGLSLVLLACGACSTEGDAEMDAVSRLPRSTPEAEGVRSEGVLALVDALDQQIETVHSLMLVRHGKVIAEGFRAPYAAELPHVAYSVSKSFNATAVGFAVGEGRLDVNDVVLSFFDDVAPEAPSPELASMRVRDLLTMSTGHAADPIDAMRARPDELWTRGFFEAPVGEAPGTTFRYESAAAYVLSAIVQRVTGQTVPEYLGPRLFEPLGMGQPLWGLSPEGIAMGDGGLYVTTEGLAKFGQLYLQRGSWDGKQLLSEQWVLDATARQIETGNRDGNWNFGYGYQFWHNPVGGFRADGSLGQFAFVLPEQDVVLAITSGTTDMDRLMTLTWQNLMPALADDVLPEAPDALSALEARLSSLSLPLAEGSPDSPLAEEVSGHRFAFDGDARGLSAVTLDLASDPPTLVAEDARGLHEIAIGSGQWLRGRTGFRARINELFDVDEQGIATSGAWVDDATYALELCFDETPYTMTMTFRFESDRLLLDRSYNVRWGARSEAQLSAPR